MKKFLKKFLNKFTISLSIAMITICSLFAMTKTYAYDYNDNTNQLVGNDLLDWSNTTITFGNTMNTNNNVVQDFNINNYIYIDNENYININAPSETQAVNSGRWNYTIRFNNINYNFYDHNYTFAIIFDSGNMAVTSYSYTFYFGYQSVTSARTKNVTLNTNPQLAPYFYGKSIQTINCYENTNYTSQYNIFNLSVNSTYQNIYGTLRFKIMLFDNNFNSNYVINNNQAFVPYSSIEQLQQNYELLQQQYTTLQQQYNDYQLTHSFTNNEYFSLVTRINTLEYQLSQLQTQYNTYVATHSHTNEDYQTLLNQYQTLQTNYNTLQNNYDTLQAQYNQLLNQIQYGSFSYLNTSNLYVNNSGTWIGPEEWNFSKLLNDGVLSYNVLNLVVIENASSYYNKPTKIEFVFNNLPVNQLLLDMRNIAMQIDINFDNNYIYNNNYNGSVTLNYEYLSNNFSDFDKVTYIEKITFYVDNNNGSKIYLNNDFANGFTAGKNSMYSFYENATKENQDLLLTIDNLNAQVSQLQYSLSQLQSAYNSLQTSYENTLSGNNFTSLFFTIAETPFSSFKQIWNVDFLGVNLSGFVTGLLFIGLMIWLVKKIF